MKIFIIGGKAKTGKNVFGDYLKEELKEYGYKPCVVRLTEPLYYYASNFFNWSSSEVEKPREFLQKMGTDIIKEKLGKDMFLINRLDEDIEILNNFFDAFIITDARYEKEFNYFKDKYDDVITIKMIRENYDDMLKEEERNHITELEIDKIKDFDYIVKNKSLDELKHKAIDIVRDVENYEGGII